jgi:PKD-like domain/Secretion system C-terminal sorting domain/HYR domain/SprB repeat
MNYKILLSLLLFLLAISKQSEAQGLFACPGLNNASSTCATSCINCNLNGLTGINNVPLPPGAPNSLCHGGLILNNPRFYGFIAGSVDVSIAVFPTNCQTGQGLEASFISNCITDIGCLPGPNPLNGFGAFIVTANNLVIGQPYQFVIDGFNGDVCDFSFTVIAGSTQGPPMGPLNPIEGLSQVCPNATTVYSIPPVANAVSYTWSSPAGSSINGGGNVRVLPAAGNNSVEIAFGNAGGNVCVTASNACSAPASTCFPVSNVPLPITQLPDLTICNNEIPYEWQEEPHNFLGAPGTYNLTSTPYISYLGCDSIVKQKLILLPYNQRNLPLRYLCKNECFEINGIEYCETGTYQEYLVSYQGCDSIVNFSLFKIPSKAVIVPPDTITCAVTSVPLSGTGSTTGNTVSYKWLNPAGQVISNAITATANEPGQHALIVTNIVGGNACRDTAYVEVPGNLTPPVAEAGPDMVLTCIVTQVQLQGSGSMGSNYSYFWKVLLGGNIVSGTNTLTPVVNAPGTYSLRVTNTHNGCTAVSNAVVTANVAPPVITTAGGTFTCTSPNVTLQASTNAPNPSYSWTGPGGFMSTAQNPVVSVAGTYTVLVTNGVSGCTATATALVNAGNDTPQVTATGGAITCAQTSVTLGASSTTQGVTYKWNGPGGFMATIPNPVVTAIGNYQVVVTAPNGCTSTASAAVVLNNTPPGTTLATSGNLNCNNNSVNVLATSMGNPANLTHSWTLPGGGTQNTGVVAFLAASAPGIYSVVVSNTATGCASSATATVIQRSDVTASIGSLDNPDCFGGADGSVSVAAAGGDGVYSYLWSNGTTTALNNNLGSGTYLATVTDGEGCTATLSATVTAPTAIATTDMATGETALGAADGTATTNPSGGTPGYTYLWSNGGTTQTISGLAPGSYTVTVTDANGCTRVRTLNVNQFDCTLATEILSTDISCFGAGNGAAVIQFMGGSAPFAILWSTGDTTTNLSNLAAGNYSVSITDASNCPEIETFTIEEPSALVANATGSVTSGSGTADGTASANPTGGSGTYSYAWSNTETTASISGLAAGSYTVTVTDSNGCTAVQTVEVEAGNCNLITNLQITNPSCNGDTTGFATILLTGGTGGFTFAWSSGGNAATETNLPAGVHTVEVTDTNGCSIIVPVELTEPTAIVATIDSSNVTSCPTAPEGYASVAASGGTGGLSVAWSNGQMNYEATGLVAGTYTATVTDENGCTATTSVTILSDDNIAPVIVASNTPVAIGPDGNVVLTVQNMNAIVTDNCVLASVVILPGEFVCTQLGDHQVTITATDDAGNVTSQTVTVTIIDNSDPILICSPSLVNCFADNPVFYQAPTATDNCLILGGSFNITEGLPIGALFPVGTTTTSYTFTDAQGNMGGCSFEVTILSPLTVTLDTVFNDINMLHIGSIFINVAGSLPPYTYSWKLNGVEVSTAQNPTGLAAGTYIVEVTDDNDCTVTGAPITVQNTTSGTQDTPIVLDGIRVFPNPTSGNLNVLLPDELVGKNVFLQVFDQTGRRVLLQDSVQDKQIAMALTGLSDGLYSLVIRIENQQVVRKIVVSR